MGGNQFLIDKTLDFFLQLFNFMNVGLYGLMLEKNHSRNFQAA